MSSVWKDCGHEVAGTEQECLYCRIAELQFELSSYEESDANLRKKVNELEATIKRVKALVTKDMNDVVQMRFTLRK